MGIKEQFYLRNDPVIKPICDILEFSNIEYYFFGSRSVLPSDECQNSDYDIAIDLSNMIDAVDVLSNYNGILHRKAKENPYVDKFTVATLCISNPDVDISVKHNLEVFRQVWIDKIDADFYRKHFSKKAYGLKGTPEYKLRKNTIKNIMNGFWDEYVHQVKIGAGR